MIWSRQQKDNNEENDSKNELLTLTPRVLKGEEKERIRPYLNRLKEAIDHEDIFNIALTGNYGSGKSTILRTFENEYSEYKYLPISLASFNDDQEIAKIKGKEEYEETELSGNKKTKLNEDIEQQLEISILQQIFYKVSADKIPDSRFKRIKDFDNKKTTLIIALSAIWVVSAFILFGFDYINDLNPGNWGISKATSWIAIISSSYFVFGLFFLMKYVYRSFSNSKINKFSFKGVIELGEESVFNKNLDEILYFFERTKFNVVVFEDIDRFDTTGIFTKLRELNKLINHCDLIDRDINFVYAVKDTVFKDKTERVKFFDFIIPVIPFVNSKNASEQLNKLIKEYELTDSLSKKFVSDVVSMIHDIDMRLLINTFHEYTVFKDNVGDEDINHEKLFSIIVYKNLYPEDFSKLYREEGKLFDVIDKKKDHVATLIKEFENTIKNLEEEIVGIELHGHLQVKELRSVYVLRLLEVLSFSVNSIKIENKNVKPIDLVEDENFRFIQEIKNLEYVQAGRSHWVKKNLTFDQIENKVNGMHSYNEREQFIKNAKQNKLNSIKNKILNNKNQIGKIKSFSLAEILEKMQSDEVYGEFEDNDLVRYFLNGGYLNENYLDYISLFHEVNLTRDEFKYLRSIKSGKEPNFEFEVSNHYALLNDLDTRYFSNKSILNYDLVEYLVNQSSQFRDKANMLYSSLANRETVYFEFIIIFIKERSSSREKFIFNLIKHRRSFADELLNDSNLPQEMVLDIVKYLFEYASIDDLLRLENIESLKGYLQGLERPIAAATSLVDKKTIQEFISAECVKFRNLEKPESASSTFFDFVINNSAYEINYSNILNILDAKLTDAEIADLKNSIYTHISESELTELKKYIEKNLNEFVSKVLLYEDCSQSEKEDSLVALLNAESLDSKFKSRLVTVQKNRISSLDKLVDQEAREIVTSANKIEASWENVYLYYYQFEKSFLNETIIKFLNNEENHNRLSESSVFEVQNVEREKLLKFRDALLYCSGLNSVAYKNILKSLIRIDQVDFSKVNSEMAEILLDEGILELNVDNFVGLKSLEGSLHIRLVEEHIDKFTDSISEYSLDNNDWYLTLHSKRIKAHQKNRLMSYLTTDELSDKNVAKKVFEQHPDKKIEGYGFDEIKVLLAHQYSIKTRISILLKYINGLSDDQLEVIVSQFGEEYKDLFGLWKKPSFPNNTEHQLLLKELEDRSIISSSVNEGKKLRAYCRRK